MNQDVILQSPCSEIRNIGKECMFIPKKLRLKQNKTRDFGHTPLDVMGCSFIRVSLKGCSMVISLLLAQIYVCGACVAFNTNSLQRGNGSCLLDMGLWKGHAFVFFIHHVLS